MKSYFRSFLSLLLAALFIGSLSSRAQVTVTVDPAKTWTGWMNWNDMDGKWLTGTNYSADKLPATFVPSAANPKRLLLGINTDTYSTNGVFNLADGTPNRILDNDFDLDLGTNCGGQTVTFSGVVESNSLPEKWTVYASVKEFTPPNYGYVGAETVALKPGAFTVSRHIEKGNLSQYGFYVHGPNTPPGSDASRQRISILVTNAPAPVANK